MLYWKSEPKRISSGCNKYRTMNDFFKIKFIVLALVLVLLVSFFPIEAPVGDFFIHYGWITVFSTEQARNPSSGFPLVKCLGFTSHSFGWPLKYVNFQIPCYGGYSISFNPLVVVLNLIFFLGIINLIAKKGIGRLAKFSVIYAIIGAIILSLYFAVYLSFFRVCPEGSYCTSSNWDIIDLFKNRYFYSYLPLWPLLLLDWIVAGAPNLPLLGF